MILNCPRAGTRKYCVISAFCNLPLPTRATTATSILQLYRSSSTNSRLIPESIVQEQDIVLLKRIFGKEYQYLTKPLKHGRKIQNHLGSLDESEIIGKAYRENARFSTGQTLRIHAPTLAEYVNLTPRKVTPVYPDDANFIVSLLDIHVSPPPAPRDAAVDSIQPRLDILEAGTGHGSLTLHLARAIHAANPPRPPPPDVASHDNDNDEKTADDSLSAWKESRRAVIHTVDVSESYSNAARKIVAGFRRGLYFDNVDFHVSDVSDFINKRIKEVGTSQIFAHILLDLPDVQDHIPTAANALRDGGLLLVFCPSVTQIAQIVALIRERDLPLHYSQVLELGPGLCGGKKWDVRAAKIRNQSTKPSSAAPSQDPVSKAGDSITGAVGSLFGVSKMADAKKQEEQKHSQERWEIVARPMVGYMVAGGGFVGVWTRKRLSSEDQETETIPTGSDESKREE